MVLPLSPPTAEEVQTFWGWTESTVGVSAIKPALKELVAVADQVANPRFKDVEATDWQTECVKNYFYYGVKFYLKAQDVATSAAAEASTADTPEPDSSALPSGVSKVALGDLTLEKDESALTRAENRDPDIQDMENGEFPVNKIGTIAYGYLVNSGFCEQRIY